MEFIESFALNVAHQLERQAESHLQQKHFDEAIRCHQKAAEKLLEAQEITTNKRCLESLQLQYKRHNQMQEIVRMKKTQYLAERIRQQKMVQVLTKTEMASDHRNQDTSNLQNKIYRAMEEADSLLEQLIRHGAESDSEEIESVKSDNLTTLSGASEACSSTKPEGSKLPKDECTVIEELRTLNHQLRSLVMQLVTQLDACTRESEILRDRVRVLEAERCVRGIGDEDTETRGSNVPPSSVRKSSLHVITDSTGGSSPFVFSPCSELSPDVVTDAPHIVTRELPVLAPLEMPTFDFDVFKKRESEGDPSPPS